MHTHGMLRWLWALACLGLGACGPPPSAVTTIPLMEPPVLYAAGRVDPFPEMLPSDRAIAYATQRAPAALDQTGYGDTPTVFLRVGHVDVAIGPARTVPLAMASILPRAERPDSLFVDIAAVREAGPLRATRHGAVDPAEFPVAAPGADAAFANRLNAQLDASPGGDLVIYVHGVRSDFANPVLAAAELQHFSGYRQVFTAYSWPASQALFAYFQDTEDATQSAFLFRRYVQYLAQNTKARRIHIVAHSAGTRLVVDALGQIALQYAQARPGQVRRDMRIGKVVLIGSDVSPNRFGGYLLEGVTGVMERLTIYTSSRDQALSLSNLVFGRRARLGQTASGPLPPHIRSFLASFDNLSLIDVTDAESANVANGHGYLRGSPWVSSDILASLNFDLSPQARGLARSLDGTRWLSPSDYPQRLRDAVVRAAPHLAR